VRQMGHSSRAGLPTDKDPPKRTGNQATNRNAYYFWDQAIEHDRSVRIHPSIFSHQVVMKLCWLASYDPQLAPKPLSLAMSHKYALPLLLKRVQKLRNLSGQIIAIMPSTTVITSLSENEAFT